MSKDHDRMIETLKEYVVPILRQRGFTGSFPHFRRQTETAVHLLTFQFDKWGGSFIVEIALCPPDGFTTHWGKHIPSNKVKAWDIMPANRLRLGTTDEQSDGKWFSYEKRGLLSFGDRFERAALEMLPLIERQAEDWWKQPLDK